MGFIANPAPMYISILRRSASVNLTAIGLVCMYNTTEMLLIKFAVVIHMQCAGYLFSCVIHSHMVRIENNPTVAFRIPLGLIDFMDWDIETHGEHRNRTEYIVVALREYEEKRAMLKGAPGGGVAPLQRDPQGGDD